ncbi:hypothetical protein MLD38_003938 [Melastoma candidum]|uniref:Uncharacterized protein n=1 Tax=Melastoma candidum TaxID=119954 RepID=A0ACB9S801_9MYRT|nr:hypothetical protein MLD38_003938 [Melastoma candidum]
MENGRVDGEETTWGTWEELVLASAVQRHGLESWDSVSMELQSTTSLPHPLTTPLICETKYRGLRCRFAPDSLDDDLHTWLEDLRRLRIAELRQEVQRYDVSILSLQLKVKKLEEEREQSSRENPCKTDLSGSKDEGLSDNKAEIGRTMDKYGGDIADVKLESDRDNRSFNESNSTEREKTGEEEEEEDLKNRDDKDEKMEVLKPEVAESCNGSSEPNRQRMEESEESKENSSDVQSSASLTGCISLKRKRKGRRLDEIASLEPLVSFLTLSAAGMKLPPIVDVLKTIRSKRHSSFFERSPPLPESQKYLSIVRQPMDLETIQSRVEKGSYTSTSSNLAFNRDLLLLINNALVFYPKFSLENEAALELQLLLSTEHGRRTSAGDEVDISKPELERSDSLLTKQKASAPIVVCRKRSLMSIKPSSNSFSRKIDPVFPAVTPVSSLGQQSLMTVNSMNERPASGTRSLRRSKNIPSSHGSAATVISNQRQIPSSNEKPEDSKTDQIKNNCSSNSKNEALTLTSTKKRCAADFLKRIKRNSPIGKSKISVGNETKSTKGSHQKKKGGKGEKQNGSGMLKQGSKEESNPSKRSVGRPSKKGAMVLVESMGKRGRESEDKEAAAAAAPRKRTRKLSRR